MKYFYYHWWEHTPRLLVSYRGPKIQNAQLNIQKGNVRSPCDAPKYRQISLIRGHVIPSWKTYRQFSMYKRRHCPGILQFTPCHAHNAEEAFRFFISSMHKVAVSIKSTPQDTPHNYSTDDDKWCKITCNNQEIRISTTSTPHSELKRQGRIPTRLCGLSLLGFLQIWDYLSMNFKSRRSISKTWVVSKTTRHLAFQAICFPSLEPKTNQ